MVRDAASGPGIISSSKVIGIDDLGRASMKQLDQIRSDYIRDTTDIMLDLGGDR